jgi:hypothetical protein
MKHPEYHYLHKIGDLSVPVFSPGAMEMFLGVEGRKHGAIH